MASDIGEGIIKVVSLSLISYEFECLFAYLRGTFHLLLVNYFSIFFTFLVRFLVFHFSIFRVLYFLRYYPFVVYDAKIFSVCLVVFDSAYDNLLFKCFKKFLCRQIYLFLKNLTLHFEFYLGSHNFY